MIGRPEFWTPPPLWLGETAFVVGSGPSLRYVDLERLRGRRVIVANSTAVRVPWADVLVFSDVEWLERHLGLVAGWQGLVVTISRRAHRLLPDRVKLVDVVDAGETPNLYATRFPSLGSPYIRLGVGRCTGQIALSLAIALGVSCAVLVGFDMKADAVGRTHEHDDYDRVTSPFTFTDRFIPAFRGWNQQALDAGVRVLNATPGSALEEFLTVDLNLTLKEY